METAPGSERIVWPPDGRTQVVDTTLPPYAQVGLIEAASATGNYYYCTGMLVGPRAVLTTAHCLYNHDERGWLKDFVFVPGLADTQTAPYGVFTHEAAFILAGYIENYQGSYASVAEWDLGLVILSSPAGESVGWAAFGELAPEPPATAKLISFPGDKPLATMWEETCDISAEITTPALLAHDCYVSAGASGGPLLSVAGKEPLLIGLLTAETPENSWAIRLTPALVAWINGIAR
jgi:V8-like Glu-specific endopeptidase